MSPCSCPSFNVISIHPGYSRSGAFTVKSQRPRKGLIDAASAADRSLETAITLGTTRQRLAKTTIAEVLENLVIQTPCLTKNQFTNWQMHEAQAQNVVVSVSGLGKRFSCAQAMRIISCIIFLTPAF